MDQAKRELQLGVTVLVAIVIFVAGFMWLQRVHLRGHTVAYAADK